MGTIRTALAAPVSCGLVAGIGGIGRAVDPADAESARVAAKAAAQGGCPSRADGAGVGYDCDDCDTPASAGRNAEPRLADTGSLMAVVGGLAGMPLAGASP